MQLIDQTGKAAVIGEIYADFRGEPYQLLGIREPRHIASTGRVWVRATQGGSSREFFPSVIGMKWVEVRQ